jgi:drug/metabolite transporter (DMT)-like permease
MQAMKEASANHAAHFRALGSLHLAVLLFGFAGLFGKWIALAPVTIVFGRSAIACIALALLLRAGRESEPRGASFEWRLAGGGIVLALHWVAFFQAIQMANVAIGLLGFASFPLFVLLLEALLRERILRRAEWTTALLVTAGLLLLVPELSIDNRTVRGLIWGVVSGFSFALLAVMNRGLASRRSATSIAFWQNGIAAAALLPLVAVTPTVLTPRDVGLLIVLGVVCTALAHTLFIRSLRALSAHVASVVAALEPVYGIALAFLLLGERPELRTLIGATMIVGAAMVASVRRAA